MEFLEGLEDILVPLGICVFLPIMVVWLYIRRKMHSDDMRKEIILAALEKNANIDIEELVKKMNKPEKLLKEKLLKKLHRGMLAFILGVGMIGYGIYLNCNPMGGKYDPLEITCGGLALSAIGIAFLANYYIGKKMLAKEMEAEEQKLRQSKQ